MNLASHGSKNLQLLMYEKSKTNKLLEVIPRSPHQSSNQYESTNPKYLKRLEGLVENNKTEGQLI